ncbi:MAG: glycosyltransferase family 9 protein [Gemmatimonadaceae bacterium]
MTSLVVQTSFIGDVVLTIPLLSTLAVAGPVDVVTTQSGAAVLAGNPHVRRLVVYDKRSKRGPSSLLQLASSIRAKSRDDTAYLAQASIRSALLARAAGYKQRIGFDTSPARLLYTRRVRFRRDQHHAERLLRLGLGDDADIAPTALRPSVYPSHEDRRAVDNILRQVPNEGRGLLALAPGSVWATKRWPYYAELAAALRPTVRAIVIGSAEDATLASDIVRATGGDAIDVTGRLTLLGSAELIRRCRALVTNDSAPLHLASAMNTPTVAVFGPTVPAFGFGPLADAAAVSEHPALECRPCHPHGPKVCPLGHWRCMRDLAVADVRARVEALI